MKNSFKSSSAKHKRFNRLKQQIAVESARLMSEEGIDNYKFARKKAAQNLRVHNEHAYPDHEEIFAQLKIHQALYQSSSHANLLQDLRNTALKAMKLFQDYNPRLTGSVLNEHAVKHSSIDIQVMADSPEEIAMHLIKHDIPYQLQEWKLYFSKHKPQATPSYHFYAGTQAINLIVLSESQRKNIPLDPLTGQAMQRVTIKQLQALITKVD